MKVLIYFDKNELGPTGGPPGYLYNLYNKLVEEKIDYIDFLDSTNSRKKRILKKIFKKMPKSFQKLYKNRINKKYGKMVYDRIFDDRKRIASVDLNKYDIVHFHSTCSLYMVKESLENFHGKVLLTSHSPKAAHLEMIDNIEKKEYEVNKNKYDKLEIMDIYAFNRADYIIFPTKEAEECYYNTWARYKEIHEKNKEKYLYLPTGINPVEVFESRSDIRAKYNIPNDAFVISFVGRHNEVKGYSSLKKIGEKIIENEKNIYFLIGGKEEPLQGLHDKRWIEIGWTNRPHDLINASDLFILPNQETYFDLILLEVLSVGKTVLVTNTGGNKYFKKFEDSGIFYYEYDDVNNAINIIKKLMKEDLKKYDDLNKRILTENFTIDIFTKNYIDLLKYVYEREK